MGIFDTFRRKKPKESSESSIEVKPQTPPRREQPAPGRWQVGDRIENRYEVHQILGGPGKSGMGIVYICYDYEFREPVAIKTFQDRFLQDRASIERFKWEAETWVRLEKDYNIVQAKYVKEIAGRPYIFMEYVVGTEQYGTDLSGWILGGGIRRDGKPDILLILNFAIQFCHGMVHAQKKFQEMGKPFVHRDVKPQNIMVTRDRVVKVTDFGLVKAFAESEEDIPPTTVGEESHPRPGLSKSGAICGTLPYMSPEQCRGEKDIDARSDIYAFGCVLYEMLTGRYVFAAQTPEQFFYHHLKTVPPSPMAHWELDKMVLRCLEKDPAQRYPGFAELEGELSRIYRDLTGEVIKPPEGITLEAWELSNKGVSLANLGFHKEAIECYKGALSLNPNDALAHSNMGVVYKDQGKLDAAIGEYKEALRLNPNLAEVHTNLGAAYQAQGKLDAAIGEHKEALRLNPNLALAHNNLGITYQAQGKLDAAIGEYKEALRLNPNYVLAHYNLGNAYKDQGKLDAAIGEYKEALRLNANHALAHNNLGNAYQAQGKLDAAIGEYKEALRLNSNDALAHNNLGIAYYDQGKLDAAIGEYKEALRLNPNDAETHYNMGIVYKDQGELDAAIGEYKEALGLNPNDALAHNNLGNAYYDQGKLDAAIGEYKEALRLNPNDAETHYNVGLAYHVQRKYKEAIECYRAFIQLAPPEYASYVRQAEENIRELKQKMGSVKQVMKK